MEYGAENKLIFPVKVYKQNLQFYKQNIMDT